MSTKKQIVLLVLITLIVGFGFASTKLWMLYRVQSVYLQGVERHAQSLQERLDAVYRIPIASSSDIGELYGGPIMPSSTSGTNEVQANNLASNIGLDVFDGLPKVSYFPVASTTFVVLHWNPGDQLGTTSAVTVFETHKDEHGNNAQPVHIFSDVSGSCGQPFDYGVKGEYFYIHKNVNPCEGTSDDWEWWYDASGKEVVEYDWHGDTVGQSVGFQIDNGPFQSVGMIESRDCAPIPIPEDYTKAENDLPKYDITGVNIGKRKILFPTALHEQCDLNELNGSNYVAKNFNTEMVGPNLTITAPDTYSVELDIRHPEKAKVVKMK